MATIDAIAQYFFRPPLVWPSTGVLNCVARLLLPVRELVPSSTWPRCRAPRTGCRACRSFRGIAARHSPHSPPGIMPPPSPIAIELSPQRTRVEAFPAIEPRAPASDSPFPSSGSSFPSPCRPSFPWSCRFDRQTPRRAALIHRESTTRCFRVAAQPGRLCGADAEQLVIELGFLRVFHRPAAAGFAHDATKLARRRRLRLGDLGQQEVITFDLAAS